MLYLGLKFHRWNLWSGHRFIDANGYRTVEQFTIITYVTHTNFKSLLGVETVTESTERGSRRRYTTHFGTTCETTRETSRATVARSEVYVHLNVIGAHSELALRRISSTLAGNASLKAIPLELANGGYDDLLPAYYYLRQFVTFCFTNHRAVLLKIKSFKKN